MSSDEPVDFTLLRRSSSLYASEEKSVFRRFVKGLAKRLIPDRFGEQLSRRLAALLQVEVRKLYKFLIGGIVGKLKRAFADLDFQADPHVRQQVEFVVEAALDAAIGLVEELLAKHLG